MSKVKVIYEPYHRYIVQLGFLENIEWTHEDSSVTHKEEITWADEEYYENESDAIKYAEEWAIEHKYVRVLDRGKK